MTLFFAGVGMLELIILIIPSALWLWAFIEVLISNFKDTMTKILWIIVVIFVPLLGSIVYLLLGRSQRVSAKQG